MRVFLTLFYNFYIFLHAVIYGNNNLFAQNNLFPNNHLFVNNLYSHTPTQSFLKRGMGVGDQRTENASIWRPWLRAFPDGLANVRSHVRKVQFLAHLSKIITIMNDKCASSYGRVLVVKIIVCIAKLYMNIVFRYKRPQPYISSPLVAKLFPKSFSPYKSLIKKKLTSHQLLCFVGMLLFHFEIVQFSNRQVPVCNRRTRRTA